MPRFIPHPDRRPAVVTGASSGIGAATALALAEAGHPVVLGARRLERCEEHAAAIRDGGGEAVALPLDLADEASVRTFAAAAGEAFGDVEVLVSNAGDPHLGRGIEQSVDEVARQMAVNLLGPRTLVSLLAEGMIARHRGDLVFVTSDSVHSPRPGMAAYTTAKIGLEGFARVLQLELEGTGVRSCIVRPGPTGSEMGSSWDPARLAPLFEEWGRFGLARHDCFLRPADVARAVLAVVSMPRGSHVTVIEVQPEAPGPDDLQGGS